MNSMSKLAAQIADEIRVNRRVQYQGRLVVLCSALGRALAQGDLAAADRMLAEAEVQIAASRAMRDRVHAHNMLAKGADDAGRDFLGGAW